jgi:hypothetical protein
MTPDLHHAHADDDRERAGGASGVRRRNVLVGSLAALGAVGLLVVVAVALAIGGLVVALRSVDLRLGPGEGRDSQRLAVDVAPARNLDDGAVVRVTSDAFAPREIVGVAVCLQEADTERRGVTACDEVQGARYAVGPDGRLDATYPVPRVIAVGGEAHDCAMAPERCILVAASAADFDRSGGQPISFATDLPATDLTTSLTRPQTDHLPVLGLPTDPVEGGSPVEVVASGFQQGEPLLVAWCSDDFERDGPTACEPRDDTGAFAAVVLRTIEDGLPTADAEGRFRVRLPAKATLSTFSSSGGEGGTGIDCRAAAGRCAFVIAAAADTKRSAVLPYELTPR